MFPKTEEELIDELQGRILEYTTTEADKLLSVLLEIFRRIPEEDFDTLLYDKDVQFILPFANTVRPLEFPAKIEAKEKIGDDEYVTAKCTLILLISGLLEFPSEEIIYTIAHEMAHCLHDHFSSSKGNDEQELEADRQVIKWGFEKELRATPYNYIYGTGFLNKNGDP